MLSNIVDLSNIGNSELGKFQMNDIWDTTIYNIVSLKPD